MNTSFRFEQPWFLLLLALLPLLWFVGKTLAKAACHPIRRRTNFCQGNDFSRLLDEGFPERALLHRLCMPDSRPCPAAVWRRHEPRSDKRYRYHAFA